jgi:glyoxylate reductase
MRPKVVVARTLPDAGLALLEQRFEVEAGGDRPEPGWLRAHAGGAAAVIADPSVRVDGDFLDAAGCSLKVVAHLIGAQALALMKRAAILVNTSRGAVVDTGALIDALRSRTLAAAGLDVYEDEQDVPTELRELPNTVLLPHIGSATVSARDATARLCAENVIAVIDGREPPAPVV